MRHRLAGRQRSADARDDGGLGRAVRVEHAPGPAPHCATSAGGQHVATGDDALGGGRGRPGRRSQRGRGDERVRDPFAAQQVREFGAAVHGRRGDHHRRAGADGHEAVRGSTRRNSARRSAGSGESAVDANRSRSSGGEVRQAAVGDHDTLGQCRSSRRCRSGRPDASIRSGPSAVGVGDRGGRRARPGPARRVVEARATAWSSGSRSPVRRDGETERPHRNR